MMLFNKFLLKLPDSNDHFNGLSDFSWLLRAALSTKWLMILFSGMCTKTFPAMLKGIGLSGCQQQRSHICIFPICR